MAIIERLAELWAWLRGLPPDFAFLLSLPFLVALTGILAELGQRPKDDQVGKK